MAKHKRWSDKPKPDVSSIDEEEQLVEQETSVQKEHKDIKSIIVSGTKYIYIIAAASLLSGIFTPLTLGVEIEQVILAILSILLGLVGGVLIFLGIMNQKNIFLFGIIGIGLIICSTIFIFEFAERSLF
tara:strand:- start:75 stop:461 length:387 start_codon:yes stop_codon:yes gene_type:complete